jgi:plasmid stabilization system protein ParE
MSYKVFLSRAAVDDIEQAVSWYEKQRIGLGYELELCIEAGLRLLEREPLIFEKRYKEVRVKFIKRFPYGIHYQIESNSIKVVAFFHMSRNPIKWERRFNKDELD